MPKVNIVNDHIPKSKPKQIKPIKKEDRPLHNGDDLFAFDEEEEMKMLDLQFDLDDNPRVRKPSIQIKKQNKKSRKITLVKMPDKK